MQFLEMDGLQKSWKVSTKTAKQKISAYCELTSPSRIHFIANKL